MNTVKRKSLIVLLVVIAAAAMVAAFIAFTPRSAAKAENEKPQIWWGIKEVEVVHDENPDYIYTGKGYELILGNSESDITSEEIYQSQDGTKFCGHMDYDHNCSGSSGYVPWHASEGNHYGWTPIPTDIEYNYCSVRIKSEIAPADMGHWFYNFEFKTVDLSKVDMRGTRSMDYMFSNCRDLESFTFTGLRAPDVNYFNALCMFSHCSSLLTVDLSALTVRNSLDSMFLGAGNLESIVAPRFESGHSDSSVNNITIDLPGDWDIATSATAKEWWNGAELVNKITGADSGKTFTRHSACTQFDHVSARAATCTQTGISKEHWVCKLCGKTYADENGETEITENLITAVIPHTEVIIPAVPPTCTQAGSTAGKKCSVCDTVLQEATTVAATGHSYGEWKAEVAATSTQNGTKAHYTCGDCGKHFDADHNEISDLAIPATGTPDDPNPDDPTPDDPNPDDPNPDDPNPDDPNPDDPNPDDPNPDDPNPDDPNPDNPNPGGTTPDNTENGGTTSPEDKEGLSGGAIAGIVVGSVALALVVLYVIGLVLYKKNVIAWKLCEKLYFFIKK